MRFENSASGAYRSGRSRPSLLSHIARQAAFWAPLTSFGKESPTMTTMLLQRPRESSQTDPFEVRLYASEFLGNSFAIGGDGLNVLQSIWTDLGPCNAELP